MRFTTWGTYNRVANLSLAYQWGCTISQFIFVSKFAIDMIVITRSAVPKFKGLTGDMSYERSSVRAFMEDLTNQWPLYENTVDGFQRLSGLSFWARIKFKPKKCRSPTSRAGRLREIYFRIAGDKISTIRDELVRILGRRYTAGMKDLLRGIEIKQQTLDGFRMLPESFKLCCFQFCKDYSSHLQCMIFSCLL